MMTRSSSLQVLTAGSSPACGRSPLALWWIDSPTNSQCISCNNPLEEQVHNSKQWTVGTGCGSPRTTLNIHHVNSLCWDVDWSFPVHPSCRDHYRDQPMATTTHSCSSPPNCSPNKSKVQGTALDANGFLEGNSHLASGKIRHAKWIPSWYIALWDRWTNPNNHGQSPVAKWRCTSKYQAGIVQHRFNKQLISTECRLKCIIANGCMVVEHWWSHS